MEVVVVYEKCFIVKKTTIYLVYDEPMGEQMEQCETLEESSIVCSGDENEYSVSQNCPQKVYLLVITQKVYLLVITF